MEGKLAVWKFIGSLLGLYSSKDLSTEKDSEHWLSLSEHLTIINVDLLRQLCRFLSPNDFLW